MLGRAIILLLALTVWGHAAGPVRSPEKLRSLAMPPSLNLQLNLSSSTDLHTNDLPARIATLRKQMQGDASDAEHYTLLGRYLNALKLETEASIAFSNALKHYRARATANPTDGKLQAKFIAALSGFDNAEAERVARASIRAIPEGWHCWVELADLLDTKASRILFGFSESIPKLNTPEELAKYMGEFGSRIKTPLIRAEIEALEKYATEADQCFDRAVALGGKEPEPYANRARHRMNSETLFQGLGKMRGWQKPEQTERAVSYLGIISSPGICVDLATAVRMAPTNAATIGSWGMAEAAINLESEKPLEGLPEPRRKNVLEAMRLLERLGTGADPQSAALALESLGILRLMVTREPAEARTAFRRAVTLDPLRTQAWDGLLYVAGKDDVETIAICEERLKHEETSRRRVMAAIACDRAKQNDKALEHARAAVKLDAQSALAHATLGAIMLRSSTDIAALLAQNTKAEELIKQLPDNADRLKIYTPNFLNRCIIAVLAGQPENVRQPLQLMLHSKDAAEEYKDCAKEILDLIGRQ